ncbi:hypothetical protein [Alienimonas californiensis]|uniref:Uncharacterized protein n=1 Tax=Alienimonas californiensis TaxID=2527989 RepID=A0A517P4Z9_9PLAN|nr:hypothetical protein [Alienimonas californiensis]QDT14463.1 hypothetical protein CA12_05360 [Alienimonas californiensis]
MPLIGNKFLEHDLRAWLEASDHYGRSAEVEELELIAVQRPGWVQVFRFRVRAKNRTTGEWDVLRGLARDDERAKRKADRTAYRLTADDAAHDAAFAEWSDGLLTLRGARAEVGTASAAAGGGAFAAAALAVGGLLVAGAVAVARWF